MKKYDLVVIGAGSAGLVAATTGKRLGLKTALLEKDKIGGECTHSGCVPSKAFLNAAKAYHALNHLPKLGLGKIKKPKIAFAKVMQSVQDIIDGIYAHETPEVFEKQGIDVYIDKKGASFIDQETIAIGNKKIRTKHAVICTGSSPRILKFKGDKKVKYLHNENFWKLRKQPKRLVFIGGGVISVELGLAMQRLGTKVTIIEHGSRILKVVDEEIGKYLSLQLEKEGVKIITEANVLRFESGKKSTKIIIECKGKEKKLKADRYFQAVGRVPNIQGMELENAGVTFDPRAVLSNSYLQTTAKNIYACGDVTTPYKFTHTASHQANICIHNIINGNRKRNNLNVLPWAIFTEPEVGHVGLSEQEAAKQFGKKISVFKVDASIDRFITDRKTGGMLKVIFNDKDQVIGADAVGQHAGEWIQLLTIAIKNRIPAAKMADTIFAYPTYSEIVKKAFTRYLRTKPI